MAFLEMNMYNIAHLEILYLGHVFTAEVSILQVHPRMLKLVVIIPNNRIFGLTIAATINRPLPSCMQTSTWLPDVTRDSDSQPTANSPKQQVATRP